MAGNVNLVCTRERLGESFTELRAAAVPDGQVVGDTFTAPDGCTVASGWEAFSYQFSTLGAELWTETKAVGASALSALPAIFIYVGIILLCMVVYRAIKSRLTPTRDYTSLKTVTFGDESAVRSDFPASILSIVLIFLIWGSFTGSALVPGFLHLPAPYTGESSFTYTVEDGAGNRDDAEVFVRVIA
ncbi:MAG: ABC transporter permease, partial [Octadecabacter sp.]